VSKVEFFRDGALLGADTSAPYSYTWANPAPGSYALTARATDNQGATRVSVPATISVKANTPPSVTLTAPAADLQPMAGTTLALAASAGDPDGTIVRVEFLAGGALIATDASSPYTASFVVPAGVSIVTAAAIDSNGARTLSAPVRVTGVINQLPSVTLDMPHHMQYVVSATPPDIALGASATDPDGTIARVRFYARPVHYDDIDHPEILIATVASPPYRATWRTVPFTSVDGSDPALPYLYQVRAEADDNHGATATSDLAEIYVLDTAPYGIAITVPAASPPLELEAPATVVIVGSNGGYDIPEDPVAGVDLMVGGVAVVTQASPNGARGEYALTWRNVPAGNYQVSLRLRDAAGFAATSPSIPVIVRPRNVLPTVTLGSPADNVVSRAGSSIALAAVARDADGRVAKVEFIADGRVLATTTGVHSAVYDNVPDGTRAIDARVTDDRGGESSARTVRAMAGTVSAQPIVAVTSPPPGTYVYGAPLRLAADVAVLGGTITRVDFDLGPGMVVASAQSPPWEATWTGMASGHHGLRATAYTSLGTIAASTPVPLDFTSNVPPTVKLTSPANGLAVLAGMPVPLAATASDADGSIAKVEFTADNSFIARATSPPYVATFSSPSLNGYAINAVAFDNLGGRTVSDTALVYVLPATEMVGIYTNEPRGIVSGRPLDITAQASMPGHAVTRIDYFVDGLFIGFAPVSGPDGAAVARLSWAAPIPGSHQVVARATAADGRTVSSQPMTIAVRDFSVRLVEPHPAQAYLAPGDVRITAAPVLSGATLARIEFVGDGRLLGTATAAPFTFIWRGLNPGTHDVLVRAVDSSGDSVTAGAQVSVLSAPSLSVAAGIDGSSLADDAATVSGRIAAPSNAAVMIDGHAAVLDPSGGFYLDGLPLRPGANLVTLTLNTAGGATMSRTITLNSTGSTPFSVDISPPEGFAPLESTMTIRNRGGVPFQRVELTDDDGAVTATLTSLPDGQGQVRMTFVDPGLYAVRVKVYDAADRVIWQTRRQLRAYDRAELAGKVLDVYASMVDRLAANDAAGALPFFTGEAQARYGEVFASLGSGLAAIAPQLRRVVDGVVTEDFAELTHARSTPEGTALFMIYLVRGRDGIWRIESM
jgi:hypothetical protein